MGFTFAFAFVAAGHEPSGFAAFIRHAPDGLRRSANNTARSFLLRHEFVANPAVANS